MRIPAYVMGALLTCTGFASLYAQAEKPELKLLAFATLDSNKDGKLSAAEAKADADLFATFESLDVNQDGFLSPEEFNAWPRAQRTSTADRDPTTVPGGSSGAQHMPSD